MVQEDGASVIKKIDYALSLKSGTAEVGYEDLEGTHYFSYLCRSLIRDAMQSKGSRGGLANPVISVLGRDANVAIGYFLFLELKAHNASTSPLLQQAFSAMAEAMNLKKWMSDDTQDCTPILGLTVEGHYWTLWATCNKKNVDLQGEGFILHRVASLGSTASYPEALSLVYSLRVVLHYFDDIFWPWVAKNALHATEYPDKKGINEERREEVLRRNFNLAQSNTRRK